MAGTAIVFECGCCDGHCIAPQPCAVCEDGVLRCSSCRHVCPLCFKYVCYDCWSEQSRMCTACADEEYRASGRARDDYMRYGRDDA